MNKPSDLEWILDYFHRILTGSKTTEEKIQNLLALVKECAEEIGMELK